MRSKLFKGSTHIEPHIKESDYIRDIVFGFGDGINTSLGIVAGVGGAQISADVVILAALVGMFTGAKDYGGPELPSSQVSEGGVRIGNKT